MSDPNNNQQNPGRIGIIGGTGLEKAFENEITNSELIKVETLFGNPSDEILTGEICGVPVAMLPRHDRKHTLIPSNVNYAANIQALKQLGCKIVISFCAVGSLKEEYVPGQLAIVSDSIDRTTRSPRSLYTGNGGVLNDKIMHMAAYPLCNSTLRDVLKSYLCNPEVFSDTKVHDHATVTIIEGPRFSTKAESFMHKSWGSDLVGMTLMPEAIMAKEAGLVFASIALVTDYDCWKDNEDGVTHSGVLEIMKKNSIHTINALRLVLPKIQEYDWSVCFAKVDRNVEASFV